MKSLDWMKSVPVMLLSQFYGKCKLKGLSFSEGAIEAFRDWLDKE